MIQIAAAAAAVQAAGVEFPDVASWTIFAPNNEAFAADDIKEDTGLTAEQLLQPEYKEKLTQVGKSVFFWCYT
jgi:uncharacterized surface protein with fasciclin (FAS1) repeats